MSKIPNKGETFECPRCGRQTLMTIDPEESRVNSEILLGREVDTKTFCLVCIDCFNDYLEYRDAGGKL